MSAIAGTSERRPDQPFPALDSELVGFVLHVLLVLSVVASMTRIDRQDRFLVLAPMAVLGLVLGYWMAQAQVPDMLAHSIALWTGALVSVAVVVLSSSSVANIVDSRGKVFLDLASDVIRSLYERNGEPASDHELLVAFGIVTWLIAYSSSWVMHRRGWFGFAIAGPAMVLLTSLHVEGNAGSVPLALFLFAAIGLAARNSFSQRSTRWARRNTPVPSVSAPGAVYAGPPLALIAVLLAITVYPVAHDALS